MPETFHLDLVTPEKPLFSGPVLELVAPGILGEFGVLPGHANLLAELGVGRLRYRTESGERTLAASGGFAEVTGQKVTVLLDHAVYADEMDRDALQKEIMLLQSDPPPPEDPQFAEWQKNLSWKRACLDVL
ncbi:MAG: ATP synthase F1 subunit epsilon [bacterium]